MSEYEQVRKAVDQAIATLMVARELLQHTRPEPGQACSHPRIARTSLITFGDEQTSLCSLCEEIVRDE